MATLPASVETYTYQCGRHDRVVLDDTADTITWNKHVFTNGHQDESECKFAFVATDKSGAVAHLCVATKGVADLDVTKPKRHLECQQLPGERK
jgi:hypothetical protein